MQSFDLQRLLGLPLETARGYLEKEKIPYEIITYESPRGELGMDRRVLRAVNSDGLAELVVGGFSTEINEDRVKHD